MMKVYKELVRVFLRSGEMDNPKQKKQKLCYTLLGLLSILGVMLPCCVLVGYIAYAFTLGLSGAGDGCLLMIHFIALFSVVFGIHASSIIPTVVEILMVVFGCLKHYTLNVLNKQLLF